MSNSWRPKLLVSSRKGRTGDIGEQKPGEVAFSGGPNSHGFAW